MKLLTAYVVFAWLGLTTLSIYAAITVGAEPGLVFGLFFDTYKNAWLAQFSTDFVIHLILIGGWVVYREQSRPSAWLWALGIFIGGGSVSLIYLFLTALRSRGNMKAFLLGANA